MEYARVNKQPFYSRADEPIKTMLNSLGAAGASIKCNFEESERTTQFIADTVFKEGEEEKVS